MRVGKANFSGLLGPDGFSIAAGETIYFDADATIAGGGFKICFSSLASGGGMYVGGGSVLMTDSFISGNNATQVTMYLTTFKSHRMN